MFFVSLALLSVQGVSFPLGQGAGLQGAGLQGAGLQGAGLQGAGLQGPGLPMLQGEEAARLQALQLQGLAKTHRWLQVGLQSRGRWRE